MVLSQRKIRQTVNVVRPVAWGGACLGHGVLGKYAEQFPSPRNPTRDAWSLPFYPLHFFLDTKTGSW